MRRKDHTEHGEDEGSTSGDRDRSEVDGAVRADGGGRPLTEVEAIDDPHRERLANAADVETVEELLAADAGELAEESGISELRIEQWKAAAEDLRTREGPAGTGEEDGPERTTGTGESGGATTGARDDEATGGTGSDAVDEGWAVSDEPPGSRETTESAGSPVIPADDATGDDGDGGAGTVTETTERESGTGPHSEEELEREILEPEERIEPGEEFCHDCGEPVDPNAAVCPECGARQEHGRPGRPSDAGGDSEEVDPMLAGVASLLLPGAGALIAEQTTRALVWFGLFLGALVLDAFIFVVSFILTAFVIGIFGFFLIPLVHLVLHPIAAYDAYNQAKKINAGKA